MPAPGQNGEVNMAISRASLITHQEGQIASWIALVLRTKIAA